MKMTKGQTTTTPVTYSTKTISKNWKIVEQFPVVHEMYFLRMRIENLSNVKIVFVLYVTKRLSK